MKTIVIVAGIIIAGATVVALVQSDKKSDAAPEIHNATDGHGHPADAAAPGADAPKLNPAHGLPGHRCDLAVGAPLPAGGPGTAPAQAPQTIQMNPVPQQAAPANPSAAPAAGVKINPAHGMPGHRCDIQVGAPLT